MQRLQYILSVIDQISEWSGKIFSFGIAVVVVLMFYEVVARYIFDAPTEWGFDMTQFIFATTAIMSGGYTLLHKSHVNVDVAYRYFPPQMKLIVNLVAGVFLFAFCGAVLWWGVECAVSACLLGEVTQTPFGGPVYLVKSTMPIGAALILLQGLANFTRDVIALASKGKLTRDVIASSEEVRVVI